MYVLCPILNNASTLDAIDMILFSLSIPNSKHKTRGGWRVIKNIQQEADT